MAELYTPATSSFSQTGSLYTDRFGATAALLPDGRVLVAGGVIITSPGFGVCTDSAELFDPATELFTPTGHMGAPRCGIVHEAPVLGTGKVLIAGGVMLDSAELFDPATGTFSATGSMTIPRLNPTETLLPNGQVLVTGGSVAGCGTGCPFTLNSAELYDPTSKTFTAIASMGAARQDHTASLLLDGRVLVTGGFDFGVGTDLRSAELFSTLGRTLTSLGPAYIWVGLKNSDDVGTAFDVMLQMQKDGDPVASGLTRCVRGLGRNPAAAQELSVAFDPFDPVPLDSGNDMTLTVLTRIGTPSEDGTRCMGVGASHSSALGLRMYYDSSTRGSEVDVTLTQDPIGGFYLRSDGAACPPGGGQSAGVTTSFLDESAPSGSVKCKDSGSVNFAAGNPFKVIGSWKMTVP